VSDDGRIDARNDVLDGRVVASPRVLCRDLGDESILLDLETETYFGLNAVGSRFWKLLTTAPTIRAALTVMLDEFDVAPEELEGDMRALVDELLRRGLLRTGNA
jgi:hypothetical protein